MGDARRSSDAGLRFPCSRSCGFLLDAKSYQFDDGIQALSILADLYHASMSNVDSYWALRMRNRIRKIRSISATGSSPVRAILTDVVKESPDPRMRMLAIWLRGHCGGYLGTSVLAVNASSPDFTTRKETVRALKRMSGWTTLREVAISDPSPRIRRMATQRAGKSLDERLSRFMKNCGTVQRSSERMRFWMLPGLQFRFSPGKTVEMMRSCLQRIERLVSASKAFTKRQ